VYLETLCNIGWKKAFITGVLARWHNCLLIYWRASCLVSHSTIPSVTCLRLTFSFPFSLLFFNISLTRPHQTNIYGSGPHQHCSVLLNNIGENLGTSLSGAQHTSERKDFGVIITIKIKTDIPHEDYLAVSFRRFVIIAELWRPKVARPVNFVSSFCVFFSRKRSLSNCRYCTNRTQILPRPALPRIWLTLTIFRPNQFAFGEFIAERVKTVCAPQSIYRPIIICF